MSKSQTPETDEFIPKAKRVVGTASTTGMVGYVTTLFVSIPLLPTAAVVGLCFLGGAWLSTKMKK